VRGVTRAIDAGVAARAGPRHHTVAVPTLRPAACQCFRARATPGACDRRCTVTNVGPPSTERPPRSLSLLTPAPPAVVGAGLAGSMAALMLAKRGYSVDLYEKRPDFRISERKSEGDS
jgi:NADPH-dependent 2,4-dienoyl-CoA reductase/sulfur reductase-like enzyme